MLIQCAHCGTHRERHTGEVNRRLRDGKPVYCSRECGNAARTARAKPVGERAWHRMMFEPRLTAVQVACEVCQRPMWLPASKVGLYTRCSEECRSSQREQAEAARERNCETCGLTFYPRGRQIRLGHGRYCSQQCNPSHRIMNGPASYSRRLARIREVRSAGLWTVHQGPNHHSWKGGPEEAKRRRIESGKAAAELRRYRAANPHKVREFKLRRNGRKLGRLPYGTIPAIAKAQRGRCAVCRVDIRRGYHVDHITPLARGGKHVARNIQLLCAPCNLRKSAKDPLVFMRETGRLL